MNRTPEDETNHLWSALCQRQRLDHFGETTGGMIHELNNGLSVVNGLLELLMETLNADSTAAGSSQVDAEQMLRLVRRDLSKVAVWVDTTMESAEHLLTYAHRLSGGRDDVDVNELCSSAVDESRYRCERENIQLSLDLVDEIPFVKGHTAQLLQVLANVVRNSREAFAREDWGNAASRMISISTQADGDRVVIHIDDNGPGIAPDLSERVFELDYSTKEGGNADSGFGLPLARMIARCHGGDLRLGERDGGTRIVVELPLKG